MLREIGAAGIGWLNVIACCGAQASQICVSSQAIRDTPLLFGYGGAFPVNQEPQEFENEEGSAEAFNSADFDAQDEHFDELTDEESAEDEATEEESPEILTDGGALSPQERASAVESHRRAMPSGDDAMIVRQADFDRYCDHLARCATIAFDTEFVSEDCHRPDLCLIQVATAGGMAVIDPKMLDNVERFWEIIVSGEHETIVHAGREEMRFCLFSTGQLPKRLFDIQIAAGFIGLEYPGAYRTLVQRLVRRELAKEETRTNWRHRPLNDAQVAYALLDVEYLIPMRERLRKRLVTLGRDQWCADETRDWAEGVRRAETQDPWRRVSGATNLDARALAIVRELWHWREEVAIRRNCPARRVLRDDLIIELAKRGSGNLQRIKNVRGLERSDLKRHLEDISQRIADVLALPRQDWPEPQRPASIGPPLSLLVQFLQTALGCLCRDLQIAPSIVATSQDLREFVAVRLGLAESLREEEVALMQGWRNELVAEPLEQLMRGVWTIGVENPLADQPLRLVGPGADGHAPLLPETFGRSRSARRGSQRRRRGKGKG